MANLLQSSETSAQQAPDWYNKYLSGLATSGSAAAGSAQFAGATPLQTNAFNNVTNAGNNYQPQLNAASNTLNSSTNAQSPLSAAQPYLSSASQDPSQRAQSYMNPYTQDVVNNIGIQGQRNIQQNLAPQATAGAVGSGQFGSQRGAQVLGQTLSNADQNINAQQATAMQTGYQNAMESAAKQNSLDAQVGQISGNAASQGQQNLTNAGQVQGGLASTNSALGLAGVNAQANLGAQQQKIDQNQQLFDLSKQDTLSGILRGYTVPTSVTKTATASPLSTLAGGVTGLGGLFQNQLQYNPTTNRYEPTGVTNASQIGGALSNFGNAVGSGYDYLKNFYENNFNAPAYTQIDGTYTPGSNQDYLDKNSG